MSEQIELRVQRLELETEQMARIIPEIHAFSREVRDLTVKVTQYIERHDNLTVAMDKSEKRSDRISDRLDLAEKQLAAQAPIINAARAIGGKIIWACIAFALSSCGIVTLLAYQLMQQKGGS